MVLTYDKVVQQQWPQNEELAPLFQYFTTLLNHDRNKVCAKIYSISNPKDFAHTKGVNSLDVANKDNFMNLQRE